MTDERSVPPQLPGLTYVQPLGSGGYADVFLYEQHSPRMPVAVKVLKPTGLTDRVRAEFFAEADTMAALGDHPYIVQVFGSGTAPDGRPYLVMKYYPPPNLAQRARSERFAVADVLRTGIQLTSAIQTAHAARPGDGAMCSSKAHRPHRHRRHRPGLGRATRCRHRRPCPRVRGAMRQLVVEFTPSRTAGCAAVPPPRPTATARWSVRR